MVEVLNVKVGDKLLYHYGFSCRTERIATVAKVTPTGRIRIDCSNSQFDKYGNEMGNKDRWSCRAYLSIPTEEDYKRINENYSKSKALWIVSKLNEQNISYEQALKIIDVFEQKECEENNDCI